ncbi:MAG: DUF1456 family protein [Bacillota bacterium]|nr:DUF1456 family protein [Bacillota bacterium]
MNNNDLLIRLKEALNITSDEMMEIFKIGEAELTFDEVKMMLVESNDGDEEEKKYDFECDNTALEAFLNGFIIFKRGRKEAADGKPSKPVLAIKDKRSVNNVMLKKLKIAFSLTADDMIDIFDEAGYTVTKGELTPLFRKEGHKHYKKCSDAFVLKFLSGLEMMNNEEF